MGTTKRVCELYAQNVDSKNTEIVAVRFGNVLGSVIPNRIRWSYNTSRYFMLIQAASIG